MNRAAGLLAASLWLVALAAFGAEPTVPLSHTRAIWASAGNDVGEVDPTLRLTNLTIILNRPREKQRAFDELLREQQDPSSPNFHRWLTPAQIGEQFGPQGEDIAAVSSWLQSQGLQVDRVANSLVRVEFSGSAGSISAAFGAPLHTYLVEGDRRIAPVGAPRIPASLSRPVGAVLGLETVRARPHHRLAPSEVALGAGARPNLSVCSGTNCAHYVTPADFATIYDVASVYQQGITGAGQTIAVLGRARVYLPDIENFQQLTGLPTKDPIITVAPNGIDPGPTQSTSGATAFGDQGEATLDVSRAASVARGATINLVISADSSTTSGLQIGAEYVIDSALAHIMSVSFGTCERGAGSAVVAFVDNLFSQAAAEGISVFVSSGDSGAAECDKHPDAPPATQTASPNAFCASGYATCVGGTEFADNSNPGAYWTTNSSSLGSALGYIPEGAWNEPRDSSGNIQTAASGGGVSAFIPTPSWQTGSGVPGVQGRYTPDVSFSASSHDGYLGCFAAAGYPCTAAGGYIFGVFSGTSASTPGMAGIAALLNQKMGAAQGNLNPRLYALAANPGNGVFHDITMATSGVASCDLSTPSMCNNSTPGPTSLAGGLAGYTVGPGYDLATGLGSIDVANLLSHWSQTTTPGQLQVPSSITFADQPVGTQSAAASTTITNVGGTSVTVSDVTGTDLTEFPGTTTCVTTLQPGSQCNLTISFAPSAVGFHSETIAFTSSGVGSPQSFNVSGSGTAATTNYQGLWWASPAGSESGWGINFAHQGDTIFATWFTYDLGGAGNWLSMTATKAAANIYSGSLYTTSGPPFNSVPFNPSQVTPTAVGSGTLSFSGANDGIFGYTIGSTSQSKLITREVFGTVPTCATAASVSSLASATNYTDLWWAVPAGSESGWGINLTHQGTSIFATWFTYGPTGKAMWLVTTAVPNGSPNAYSGTVYQTAGPAFNSAHFDPSLVHATAVGTTTLTFTSGNAASLAYTVNGISQVKSITRELFSPTGTVCH